MAKAKMYGVLIASMMIWSFSFVWTKMAYESFQPITVVLIRLVLATVFLIGLLFLKKKLEKVPRKDWTAFLLLAFFEPFLYFAGESLGLKFVTPTIGSVIVSTIPLFTPIAAFFFLKEKVTVSNMLGILVSIIGVFFMVSGPNFELVVPLKGLALLFLAVLAAIGYPVVLKRLIERYKPTTIVAYQNLIGIFYFFPFFWFFERHSLVGLSPDPKALLALVLLAIFASVVAFVFFSMSIRHLGVTRSNIFVNLIPAFTALFSALVLNETITGGKVLGILLVISGVFISQDFWKYLPFVAIKK